jgi:ABC-type phosphate transport system substrate-binding protein
MTNKKPLVLRLGLVVLLTTAVQSRAAEIVVVMGSGAGTSLTKDQIASIYLGRNNGMKPIDLPASNPLRESFYKKATDRDSAQIKAVWSRLLFTGQGQPPKELADAAAVKKAVAADPKAIGYIDKNDLDASVKVVALLN